VYSIRGLPARGKRQAGSSQVRGAKLKIIITIFISAKYKDLDKNEQCWGASNIFTSSRLPLKKT
jgi:hypothetical protein